MQLDQSKNRAKPTNKVVLDMEEEKDSAEKEGEELIQPKRARTHAATANDDDDCQWVDRDLVDHRREVRLHEFKTEVMFRSALMKRFK